MFLARLAWFLVPGCFAQQLGKVSCSFTFPPPFLCLLILTIYLGSLAATRSSQGGQRSAALGGRGFRSLAAGAAATRAVYGVLRLAGAVFSPWLLMRQPGGQSTVCCNRRVWFSVPGCFAKQPGQVCRSFPFPSFFFVY